MGASPEEALRRAPDAIESVFMGLLELWHASRLDQLEAAFRALGKRLPVHIDEAA